MGDLKIVFFFFALSLRKENKIKNTKQTWLEVMVLLR